jgi:hypothetical protein
MTPEGVIQQPAAPVVEAPPPAPEAPPAPEPTPVGNWLLEQAVNDGAEKTPLPAEAPAASPAPEQSAAAPAPAPAKPEDKPAETPAPATAQPPAAEPPPTPEAKPTPTVEADEELTPEENALVQSRPEAEQPELGRKLKTARFWDHYYDQNEPAEQIRQHLEMKSASRYGELEDSILKYRLQDTAGFADRLFKIDEQLYGQVALEVFNGDQPFFIKLLTGKDVDAATVKAAVDAYDPTKPPAPVETGTQPVFTAEEIEDVRLYVGEEAAKKLEAVKAAPPADVEALRAKVAELEAKQAKPTDPAEEERKKTEQETLRTNQDQIWTGVTTGIESYVTKYADDAKSGLGLKVTDEERKLAPLVSALKDIKRAIFLDGIGTDLADFEKGFGEWGIEFPEFKQALVQALHYSEKLEKPNADAAGQRLLPFAERYFKERLKHPMFGLLDEAIQVAASRTNPKVTNDAIIPGAPVNSQTPPSGASARISDMLLQDALSVR